MAQDETAVQPEHVHPGRHLRLNLGSIDWPSSALPLDYFPPIAHYSHVFFVGFKAKRT